MPAVVWAAGEAPRPPRPAPTWLASHHPSLQAWAAASPTKKTASATRRRQTEDPLAPPCVGYYSGDNGGATYVGVTGQEIRILIYVYGGGETLQGPIPSNAYYDLATPARQGEPQVVTAFRNWQRYFNYRFQTYGRLVHTWVYFNNGTTTSAQMVADAAANWTKVHPFAVVTVRSNTSAGPYIDAMEQHGVLAFGAWTLDRTQAELAQYPGLEWSFKPPVDSVARLFTSYVCAKVVPNPVNFSGDPGADGKRRVYGFMSSADPTEPEVHVMQTEAEQELEACGVHFAAIASYPNAGGGNETDTDTNSEEAAESNMAKFKEKGVTTILWASGEDTSESQAAATLGYFPEWITADDGFNFDVDVNGRIQQQTEWAHAWVITPTTLWNANGNLPVEQTCYDAYTSVDPQVNTADFSLTYACEEYDDLRQLFTGIQIAGADLTPTSMGEGFHAIPPHLSSTPDEPACFYPAGMYNCVQDGVAMWWDPSTPAGPAYEGENDIGTWRVASNGARFAPGAWPPGQPTAQKRADDVANLNQGWD